MAIDYEAGRIILDEVFAEVEGDVLANAPPAIQDELLQPFEAIFTSSTQAYRESLVGCAIARLQDQDINIRLPYRNQGSDAYNGRTLDEKVVNPFLHEHRIPCSRGPFLSTFRRSIRFDKDTERGLRDKQGYRAFLRLITHLEKSKQRESIRQFLRFLLFKFAKLREASEVPLSRLQRLSLEQYGELIKLLLRTPSGGRLPVLVVVAAFRTINEFFEKGWTVEFQGINVADSPSGAGGDITIFESNHAFLSAEVTERPLDRSRLVATFNNKIAPHGLGDYLFFVSLKSLSEDAKQQARQYFAQGSDVNFIEIREWVLALLATMGKRGREIFNGHLLSLMDDSEMPRQLKVAWNDYIARLTAVVV